MTTLFEGLVLAYKAMDRQNIPKEGRVIRVTKAQAEELKTFLTNPTKLPNSILGCKLEIEE